ncbi:lytic transglycosylase domain-containing protein [Salmonella enterica]
MKRVLSLMLCLAPLYGAQAGDDGQILYTMIYGQSAPVTDTYSEPAAENLNPQEWNHLIQARWGETRSLSEMELLQEVKQAVIADIEDVRQTRARENKPFVSGDIEKIITHYADKFNIDPRIIFEIIRQESGFDPDATGRQTKYGTAKGLMQLMDMNSKPHGIDPYNPEENIRVGTALFANLLNKYQDIELALAAYNAGEGAVDKYGGIPPYKETQHYVKKITERLSDENQ